MHTTWVTRVTFKNTNNRDSLYHWNLVCSYKCNRMSVTHSILPYPENCLNTIRDSHDHLPALSPAELRTPNRLSNDCTVYTHSSHLCSTRVNRSCGTLRTRLSWSTCLWLLNAGFKDMRHHDLAAQYFSNLSSQVLWGRAEICLIYSP